MTPLIHSMSEFSSIIFPLLELAECERIVEVGGEFGDMTTELASYVQRHNGVVDTIDPAPQPELREFVSNTPGMNLIEEKSLQALFMTKPADVYLVDGDHNYYTVLHELGIIFSLHQETGTDPLVILHDVGWPCAYRDQYYDPESIPIEWRHPHNWDLGVTLDSLRLVGGGFRGKGAWAPAIYEGGPRNGVLKAVEDFMAACDGELLFHLIPAVFGLGVLHSASAPWAAKVSEYLAPYNRNPLLAKLERNRLENYLQVIGLQDRLAEVTENAV
jgi:methyltransferase family protein